MSRPSLLRDISPPPVRRTVSARQDANLPDQPSLKSVQSGPSLASIEAGKAIVDNHLDYFSQRLQAVVRPDNGSYPRLSIAAFRELYLSHHHDAGCHFVVHQHDHPIAGVHYDLRLQFSASSAISFAIPYGLPGNPNSIRPHRMAIETRVHNMWNNLVESASRATGSLLIWDTGRYEILPYRQDRAQPTTDDEQSEAEQVAPMDALSSNSQKLFTAFQEKHIRLRLHGCRLPSNYTITLRITTSDKYKPTASSHHSRKRRRIVRKPRTEAQQLHSDEEAVITPAQSSSPTPDKPSPLAAGLASDEENSDNEEEDATIRANNAYTGSTNSIGSVHQRHWFLSLDKKNSGFTMTTSEAGQGSKWIGGWEPFFVMGRDTERSVVTGRTADQVMSDEGVKAFAGRKMWRPITE